jgi:hypothetical protein
MHLSIAPICTRQTSVFPGSHIIFLVVVLTVLCPALPVLRPHRFRRDCGRCTGVLRWETESCLARRHPSGVLAGARDQRRLHAMRPPARASSLPGPIAERRAPRREPLPQPSRRALATATTWLHRGTSAIGR